VIGYRVDIFDDASHEQRATCHGPTTAGLCPWARPDGTVRCAGARIAPLGSGPGRWQQWVPVAARKCPLSQLGDLDQLQDS
jgi:hypothetical protein